MPRQTRPELLLELDRLGVVDPFSLRVEPSPDGPLVFDPGRGRRVALEAAGLHLAGASQALLALSMRWMAEAGGEIDPEPEPAFGEARLILRRREARLLNALLKRHLGRLPQPPSWMPELQKGLQQVDEFLRWEAE